MNSDLIEGTARETVGKLREGAGGALGDARMQTQGAADQIAGAIQHGFGQIKENAKTVADGSTSLGDIGHAARKLGRQITDTLQEQLGDAAPTYTLAGAIAFLGVAILWAGRDRN